MSKRVLLIEDNEQLRRMYERTFTLHHCSVESTPDGEHALAMLASAAPPPDVVILDAMLPGMDGIEVLRAIKADPKLAAIPVVILTNSINEEKRGEYLAAGAARFLVKMNTTPEAVVTTMEEVCAGICDVDERP